jgi:hypothetical protein
MPNRAMRRIELMESCVNDGSQFAAISWQALPGADSSCSDYIV